LLEKIDYVLTRVENFITGTLFLGSLVVLGVNIIMRYIFSAASSWAEEAIRYAIIWVSFIGCSQCAKAGSHVGIDIVVDMFPPKLKKISHIIALFLALFFCFVCCYLGILITKLVIITNQKSAAIQMPMWLVYISIVLGFGLTALRFLIAAILKFKEDVQTDKPWNDEQGNLDITKL
jgi:C4-dicarboxylate transporter DctQ subunit